jgi:hypothetical protein
VNYIDPSWEVRQFLGEKLGNMLLSIFMVETAWDESNEEFYEKRSEWDLYNVAIFWLGWWIRYWIKKTLESGVKKYNMVLKYVSWTKLSVTNVKWKIEIWWKSTGVFDYVLVNRKINIWYSHSYLAWWKSVNYAGTISIKNWILSSWSNMSWHYMPNYLDTVWINLTRKMFNKFYSIKLSNFNPIKF